MIISINSKSGSYSEPCITMAETVATTVQADETWVESVEPSVLITRTMCKLMTSADMEKELRWFATIETVLNNLGTLDDDTHDKIIKIIGHHICETEFRLRNVTPIHEMTLQDARTRIEWIDRTYPVTLREAGLSDELINSTTIQMRRKLVQAVRDLGGHI